VAAECAGDLWEEVVDGEGDHGERL
jgi:hypothetical protein